MFPQDLRGYRVIDISHTVVPGEEVGRPFAVQKALLQDQTFRYDILRTHSHVGSHVEVGAHYYEGGKSITDYPLERFYGPGVLWSLTEMEGTRKACERALGSLMHEGDVVVIRNDTGVTVTKRDLYLGKIDSMPLLRPEAAEWLVSRKVRMLVLDYIRLGKTLEENWEFHDIILGNDAVLVEIVANLDQIASSRFFVMALPYRVKGLDSSFCRPVVIEPADGEKAGDRVAS